VLEEERAHDLRCERHPGQSASAAPSQEVLSWRRRAPSPLGTFATHICVRDSSPIRGGLPSVRRCARSAQCVRGVRDTIDPRPCWSMYPSTTAGSLTASASPAEGSCFPPGHSSADPPRRRGADASSRTLTLVSVTPRASRRARRRLLRFRHARCLPASQWLVDRDCPPDVQHGGYH
jgi:hypothetical protein